MSRLSDAILPQGTAFSSGHNAPMVDLQYGGMNGFAADLTQWVSNQNYVKRNLFCLLLEAPKGFQFLDNPDKWVATLRALVELHPESIDGLNAGLEVEVTDTGPVGGSGEQHQDFMNVTRARSEPVFKFKEKMGMPIQAFFRGWITQLMMNPDSKVAGIATRAGNRPTDMLADMYAATMIFIEPDPTHTKVMKAFLCTNMFPKSSGELTAKRDLTAGGEAVSYDIGFSAITQFGEGVDAFAQTLLDSINIVGANPSARPAFVQSIAADVAAANVGYKLGAETLGNTALKV